MGQIISGSEEADEDCEKTALGKNKTRIFKSLVRSNESSGS